MTVTRGHSCALCQQRKIRCDQQKPCANCVKAKVDCIVVPLQPIRKRVRRPQERDLLRRIQKYEAYMSQHGLDFHSILDDEYDSDIFSLEHALENTKTSPDENSQNITSQGEDSRKPSKWFPYCEEYRTTHAMLHDSSEDELDRPTIHHSFDIMFENTDSFPFVVGGFPARITDAHPTAIQTFQLWQVYLNNVNPLLKISHIPTLQPLIVEACSNISKISKPLEVLMFGIYLISVNSLSDEEIRSGFGEEKTILLAKYNQAMQQALINAGFMKSTELMVLQAYLLYLFTLARYVDPRSLHCLIGIAVRIATRLGLHRDGAKFGLPPFEVEQRRRLWWQIVTLDKRIAEITGSTTTALSSTGIDCRLPLRVNDMALHPNTKQSPSPDSEATEMIFSLTRFEITIASSANGIGLRPAITNKFQQMYSSTSSSTHASTPRSSHAVCDGVDKYCAYMESMYVQKCDSDIAIQSFTLMMTRMSLCNFRLIEFMLRGNLSTNLDGHERDKLLLCAIQILEYDNVIHTNENLRGFLWYMHFHMPMMGYLFVVNELLQRTTGDLCERAWKALLSNHSHRGLKRNLRSPMHIDFGNRLIRAWDAYKEAQRQLGTDVQTPELVTLLRQKYSEETRKDETAPEKRTEDSAAKDGMMCDNKSIFAHSIGDLNLDCGAVHDQLDWTQLTEFGVLEGFGGAAGLSFSDEFYDHTGGM
ncbi:fungal-specific transcription factor domain-containing protein [Talaromyces proteolyticus]|uniref:Fungal-specific transcription factor domain-containing protein n=1 Tax=Talaromyces proteolyticus TaxID=1131652 RepID=A0AAD4KHU1_9EURO|nr:fungal-specific transcription factor domain-containing protein [Talaromyces proteolyticus]KAH8692070.1 fungal-specific transcription factor domain-containing protein [Talaromyces proteolyticus]